VVCLVDELSALGGRGGVEDEQRFLDFVDRRQAELVRLGWALTGDRHLGQDLAQAALERLLPHWSRVATGGEPIAYAQRIVVTLAASWQRRRSWAEQPVADLPVSAVAGIDIETRERVHAWVEMLPPRQRVVIVLRFLLDLSVEQTAAHMGCSTGTVKSQTAKAMGSLRALAAAEDRAENGVDR
jgi:RNA polymerase sigma-70 factor (sigma-E family)